MIRFFAADFEDLGEDEQQHPEQHQRPDQRPDVAEHGAEIDALELGHRDQPEQVEEAPGAAAERRGSAHLRQLGRLRRRLVHCLASSVDGGLDPERRRTLPRVCGSPPKTTKSTQSCDVQGDAAVGGVVDPAVDEVAALGQQVLDLGAGPALALRPPAHCRRSRPSDRVPNWKTPTPSALAMMKPTSRPGVSRWISRSTRSRSLAPVLEVGQAARRRHPRSRPRAAARSSPDCPAVSVRVAPRARSSAAGSSRPTSSGSPMCWIRPSLISIARWQ